MLKFGIVSEVDPQKSLVRVKFEDIGIVSDWLPIVGSGSLKDKQYSIPSINEHVVCIMDHRVEDGACLGTIYNKQDTPAFNSADKRGIQFEDGSTVYYDKGDKKLYVESKGTISIKSADKVELLASGQDVEVTCSKMTLNGDLEINGGISANGDMDMTGDMNVIGTVDATGIIKSQIDVQATNKSLLVHVHSGVTPGGGTSGPPV